MKRKLTLFALLPLLLVLLGQGCKGLTPEQQASVAPVTLNYWTVFNDVAQLKAFAAEYQKIRSYVTVNVRQVRAAEFEDLFVNALADDVPPDVISVHIHDVGKYAGRLSPMPASVRVSNVFVKGKYFKETVVETITQAMPSVSNIRRDYVGAIEDDVTRGGAVYGLPLAFDTLAIYYNRDLLDKAGIAEPPKTWNEFLDAVKKTTQFDRDGNVIQSGVALGTGNNIENAFDILSLLLLQNGVTMAQGGRVGFASGLDRRTPNHPTFQALQFYTDFARPTKDVYSWDEEMASAFDSFVSGKSAFYFGFAFDRARIRSRAPRLSLEVIPVLQLNESAPVNVANYWIESVPARSKHPNEAWDFVRFMTTATNVKRYTEATGQPSPLRSHLAEQTQDSAVAAFAAQALTATNWYHGRNIESAKQAFADLLHALIQPYGPREEPAERDAALVQRAAQVVQQTL